MKRFMDDNFLLGNETAQKLYHEYAKHMPIYDYHCHLSPKDIAENRRFNNITEIWLNGDHYKWRLMRGCGIDEKYITGPAEDKEKFLKWAETVPYCIGNPIYHWTHLELKRFFGIDSLLNPETAEEVWDKCNKVIQGSEFTTRSLIKGANVKILCTTDDPIDSLEYHKAIAEDTSFKVKVLPTFRPDKAMNIEKEEFLKWLGKLSDVAGFQIDSLDDIKKALRIRLEHFHEVGCRLSDHAIDYTAYIKADDDDEVKKIFKKTLGNERISQEEVYKYKTAILLFLGREYARLGWTMQLHTGALRNVNTKMFKVLGPDTGFDTIGDGGYARPLSRILDSLEETEELPKTILYCLNPTDNEALATLAGCHNEVGVSGKVQFGSGWWFNDNKDGMTRQMIALANNGLLSKFIGMLTDSRSYLSYTRHEYFRRILCNLLGDRVENGEAPNDMKLMERMVQDICYNNAYNYFGINID